MLACRPGPEWPFGPKHRGRTRPLQSALVAADFRVQEAIVRALYQSARGLDPPAAASHTAALVPAERRQMQDFLTSSSPNPHSRPADERIDRATSLPFFAVHVLPFAALWTGATAFDWALCGVLYGLRMFFITAGYHRYFAHRSFRTSRAMQLLLAFGGGMAAQKGALWWAAHHRHHH